MLGADEGEALAAPPRSHTKPRFMPSLCYASAAVPRVDFRRGHSLCLRFQKRWKQLCEADLLLISALHYPARRQEDLRGATAAIEITSTSQAA